MAEGESGSPHRRIGKVYVVCSDDETVNELKGVLDRAKSVLELFFGWQETVSDLDDTAPSATLAQQMAGIDHRMMMALYAIYPAEKGGQMAADIESLNALAITSDVKQEGGSH